ncbi:unnamed protein product [Linum trigynum]|uniref:Retrotransposon gag domain-containing protein n=1 Tax=Linum trigynum TaxID=586398 RepID=A0AAV2EQA0_9ROSI
MVALVEKVHMTDGVVITWEIFASELWTRFGPADEDDADEAITRIKQIGLLQDYQQEFERLGNKVDGWTQKSLVGTFIGGLKPENSETLRLYRPDLLKEAIRLARIREDQISRI